MNKQFLTTAAFIVAGILILGGLIYYYGITQKQAGKSEVYTKIAEGKLDRSFTYYLMLSAPKPVRRNLPGTRTVVDSSALDSLQKALGDSSKVIQALAQEWTATVEDSATFTRDSISVTFRAVHFFTVDNIRKVLHDYFVPADFQFPVRVEEKVIVRDPTFWDNVEMVIYGTAIGALIVTLIHAL